jgi:hypothetical protein
MFSVFAMTIGAAYYGYAVGTICSIVANNDLNAAAYHDKLDLIYSWVDHHQLPPHLRGQVLRYFKKSLSERAAASESTIMNDLSPPLRKEVAEFVISAEVRENPLFDGLPMNAVARLQNILQKVSTDAGNCIITPDESGTSMYIIRSGTARLEPIPKENGLEQAPRTLSTGDSFGEEILAGLAERYKYKVSAVSDVQMFMIEEGEFMALFANMPDIVDLMRQNAAKLTSYVC